MLLATDRRDRLDPVIAATAADSEYTPVVTRLGCLRGVSTLTAFALAVEIGDWHRLTGRSGRRLCRVGAQRVVLGRITQHRDRSPRPATGTSVGCRSKRPAPPPAPSARRALPAAGIRPLRRHGPAGQAGNRCLHARWASVRRTRQTSVSRQRGDRRELAGWCWSLAVLDD